MHNNDEERREAMRKSWAKYNATHKEGQAAHNREYVKRPLVKARIKAMRLARENAKSQEVRSIPANEDPA